ncbi:kielin/chordin-like protein [Littorina saxatilis]|uniref:VWFC domain-containing protein n=1 Tax=Littorina saxatilis TaxID=31220 RepID=A0AAN9BUV4_9CAEN
MEAAVGLTLCLILSAAVGPSASLPSTLPAPTPPSPQPCQLPNGTVMAEVIPGGSWSSGPMCASCNCPAAGGIMTCYPLPCQPPQCSNPQFPPGGYMCCGTCPPPPPPPTTTAPNGCWYSNGTQVPNVLPGDSFSLGSSCGYCDCSQTGLVTCYAPLCVIPPCVDPQSNGPYCCAQCPNGPNCYGPGGVIVQGQQTVDGMVCQCQMDYSGHGGPPEAECVPIPTTLPPGCRDYGGDIIPDLFPGGHWQSADGCRHCQCDQSGQAMCYHQDCVLAMCVDRESVPGQCCDTCPNGFNCRTPQGTVIAMHQSIVENGMNCSCPIFDPGYGMGSPGGGGANPQAVCFPQAPTTLPPPTTLPHPTTPPPPAGCRLYNGTVLKGVKPGDKVDLGPCKFCNCGERWEVYCAMYRCARAPCSNAVVPKGKCCSECPNGPDCTRSDGSVVKDLKPGDRVTNGCETCTCDKYGKAMCYWMACMLPLCADAVVPKGGCCAKCPNGENCKLKSGKLLPVGKTVKENGVSCTCVKDERSYSVALRCKSLWLPVLYPAPVKSYVQPKLLITFD